MSDPIDSKFFEHGRVTIGLVDDVSQLASLEIVMPYCLLQTITPQLLSAGVIDELRLNDPIAVWFPSLSNNRLSPLVSRVPDLDRQLNEALTQEITRVIKIFSTVNQYLIDPTDISPMLPLGVYVKYTYRCRFDKMLSLLEGINSIKVVGVGEFQVALASVLSELCHMTGDITSLPL